MEMEHLFWLNFKSHNDDDDDDDNNNNNNNNNIGVKLDNKHWYDHVLKSVERSLEVKVLWNQ
jgi:hypothetical protein